MNERILRFEIRATGNPLEIWDRLHLHGRTLLNRTAWRGKEPRTCGIVGASGKPYRPGSNEPKVFEVRVAYRPPGCITYTGDTRYDGWTAMLIDRAPDGTLLDGKGSPLPLGKPPVYLPFELYDDVEFNDIDFGEFLGEEEVPGVDHIRFDEVVKSFTGGATFSADAHGSFVVARRSRPTRKIILSSQPTGPLSGPSGHEQVINVNINEPHLKDVVMRHLKDTLAGFLEGRLSLTTMSGDDSTVLVLLSDCLVDCTPNESGGKSRSNVLDEFTPGSFLEDLAKQTMATYEAEARVVEGAKTGLLLRRIVKKE